MPTIAFHEIEINKANQAIYCGGDNFLTKEIDQVRQNLRDNDTLIYDLERALQGPVLELMLRGFRVDIDERDKAIELVTQKRASVEKILSAIITAIQGSYDPKFPRSDKQLRTLFYDHMRLIPIEKHINGETKRPMDRETLEKLELQDKWAAPIINAILQFRDHSKSLEVLEKEIDSDFRWRCSYNIGGTNTGRFSSSKSPFGTASNFQNIHEDLRRVFIPDSGYKLYGIDKAQSESHDVAWFCGTILGDWTYLDACQSGDLHTFVTRMCYPDWAWTGDLRKDRALAERRFYRLFTYRDVSKRVGHATNYLGTPKEISRQTRLPQNIAEEFQERYFTAFPCIPQMHQWISQELQRHRFLVNSFGRRRDFFDRPDSRETLKSAVAYMFQSATADALNLGMYRLWKNMRSKVQLLSQLHDAVYFQAPITDEESERTLIRECVNWVQITQRDPKSGRSMTIPGEPVGGFNWAHRFRIREDGTKEEWNKHGLDSIRI